MTMDEGTPKRRRGLFRRGRSDAAPASDTRLSADGFDDPWSASAWDDWDDDFTNGGTRSSVPAAAAPRPEAVDAWLQSEADDFDTAARRNTKRWGGDANRISDPGTGLSSLRAESGPTAVSPTTPDSPTLAESGLAALRSATAGEPENSVVLDEPSVHDVPVAEMPVAEMLSDGLTGDHITDRIASDDIVHDATHSDDAADSGPVLPGLVDIDADTDDLADHQVSDWATDPDLIGIEAEPDDGPDDDDLSNTLATNDLFDMTEHATTGSDPSVDDALDDLHAAHEVRSISPTWEPLTSPVEPTDAPDADEIVDDELVLTDHLEAEPTDINELDDLVALDEIPDELAPPRASWAPTDVTAAVSPETDHDDGEQPDTDFVGPAESASIDVSVANADTPFVASEEVRVRLPGIGTEAVAPVTAPPPPASRFVTVSVVSDDDGADQVHQATDAATDPGRNPARDTAVAGSGDRSFTSRESGSAPPDVGESAGDHVFPASTPPTVPAVSSRRWAALAAEFSSDGDLDDSFPSRPKRAKTPRTPVESPLRVKDSEPVAVSAPHVAEIEAVRVEVATPEAIAPNDIGPDAAVSEDVAAEHSGVMSDLPVGDLPVGDLPVRDLPVRDLPVRDLPVRDLPVRDLPVRDLPVRDVPGQHGPASDDGEADPWALPPVRERRPLSAEDPWARSPMRTTRSESPERSRPPVRPDAPGRTPDHPPRPLADRDAGQRAVVTPRPAPRPEPSAARAVSPDISTFAGFLGSALVGFAIVRIVFTMLGDQPAVPRRFTGTEASLLRVGESFGSAGSAWPLALAVGTILLTLPSYLGITSHLRRWAPPIGLAAATGIVSVLIGFLRFSAGRRLDSASTLKLLSDVIVGPVGFGALTVLAVALAIRSRRS